MEHDGTGDGGGGDGGVEAVLRRVRASASDYVKVAIVDVDGVLRGKYLDRDKFLAAAAGGGFGFCDVVFGWDSSDECYDAGSYTGWRSGYPDGAVRIDLATHRQIPWEAGRDFFLCDFAGSGAGYDVCPRLVLKGLVERAAAAGFSPRVALELEWFNFRESPGVGQREGLPPPDPDVTGDVRLLGAAPEPPPGLPRRPPDRAARLRCAP